MKLFEDSPSMFLMNLIEVYVKVDDYGVSFIRNGDEFQISNGTIRELATSLQADQVELELISYAREALNITFEEINEAWEKHLKKSSAFENFYDGTIEL